MMTSLFSIFLWVFMYLSSLPSILVSMIFLSFLVFFSMWVSGGGCWFPIIFYLLFVGGVLVIFMVVSSLFPNSNIYFPPFMKKLFVFLLIPSLLILISTSSYSLSSSSLKSLILAGGNFYGLTILILCYFFSFIYFISKDKVSLRSFF